MGTAAMAGLVAYAAAWSLWRRWLGGWIGVPKGWGRVPHVIVMTSLCLPFWIYAPWAWPAMTGLSAIFWLPGHRFDNLPNLLRRYGPIGLPWHFARLHWPEAWVIRTGKTWLIDGWASVGELGAGLLYGLVLGLLLWAFI